MIEFDGHYQNVKITDDGAYIKIWLNTDLIKFVVGSLVYLEFEPIVNAFTGKTVYKVATRIKIDEIVAVKFQDGTLKNVVDGVEKLD